MSNYRKGIFVSIIVIFVLLMISGGAFFTALAGKQTVKAEVTYSTRDVSNLAETRIRAEQYQKNLGHELLYSFTQVSYLEAQKEHSWEDGTIPPEDKIKKQLKNQILNHDTYGINNQKMIYGCSASPEYQNLEMPDNHTVKLTPSQDTRISCNEKYTAAAYNLPINKTKENPHNNYIPIAVYATNVAQKFLDLMPETVEGVEGTGSTKCHSSESAISSEDKDNAREEAKSNAQNNFKEEYEEIVDEAWSSTDGPNYVQKAESSLNIPAYDSPDATTEKVSNRTSSCTFEEIDCSAGENPPTGSDKTCPTSCGSGSPHPGTDCTLEISGKKYEATFNYTPSYVEAYYNLRDGGHQIKVWKDGEVKRENLNYGFSIRKKLN